MMPKFETMSKNVCYRLLVFGKSRAQIPWNLYLSGSTEMQVHYAMFSHKYVQMKSTCIKYVVYEYIILYFLMDSLSLFLTKYLDLNMICMQKAWHRNNNTLVLPETNNA